MIPSPESGKKGINRMDNDKDVGKDVEVATTTEDYGKSSPNKSFTQLNTEINEILHNLMIAVNEADNRVQQCNTNFVNLESQLNPSMQQTLQSNSDEFEAEVRRVKTEAEDKVAEVYSATVEHTIPELEKVYQTTTHELQSFNDEQRLIAFGKEPERQLDEIDGWIRKLAESFHTLKSSLSMLLNLCRVFCREHVNHVQGAIDKIEAMQRDMIATCLVIETQPPPIIRRNAARCGAVNLRVLSCNQNMEVVRSPMLYTLINDEQASELSLSQRNSIQDSKFMPDPMGDLRMTEGSPFVDNHHRILFKDFRVTNINWKRDKMITEQQFHIFFQVTVNIEGMPYSLWAMTLPMIITSNPGQEGNAFRTILWDNALSIQKRQPFPKTFNPENVSWTCLIELIDLLFLKVGKRLSENNKAYLKNKLFRGKQQANDMVSYNLFCKDDFAIINIKLLSKRKNVVKSEIVPGPDGQDSKKFTFWMWVWSFLDLLNWTPEDPTMADYSLKKLWNQNKILGFISQEEIINELNNACRQYPNTNPFLLRFPEGRPESIGVYFLGGTASGTEKLIKFTYLKEDKISLHERIRKNNTLTHLLPNNIPKEEAF